jgi:hypothetical protein
LASIKLKRAKLALFAPPIRSKASIRFSRPDVSTTVLRPRLVQPATRIDVEKSYGQKAAFAVVALR